MESITASPADASSLEHVEGVIAENEELRRRVSDLLHEQLALVETKEQLELIDARLYTALLAAAQSATTPNYRDAIEAGCRVGCGRHAAKSGVTGCDS